MGLLDPPPLSIAAAATRYARRRRAVIPGKVVICGRNVCQRPNATTAAAFTHHKSFRVFTSATDLVFRFTNYNASAVKEAVAASAITIRASVRVGGQNHEITKNGARDLVITQGYLDSDPVSVEVNAGDTIIVSTYLVTNLPYSTGWSDGATGATYGDTYTNGDATGPTAAVGAGTSAHLYGPSLIVGTPQAGATVKAVVGIFGDSISRGYNDAGSYGGDGGGFIVRALETASLPWVMASRFGSSGNDWTDIYGRKIRAGLIADVDYMVVYVGINDLYAQTRTAAQAEASLIAITKDLAARRGIPCYVCTIGPNTSSTDNWATTANQTINATPNANRVTYNDWIRDGLPVDNATSLTPVATGTVGALRAGGTGHPVKGYFEVADTVESARNSGLWKANGTANYYSYDGLHPYTNGHAAMAAAIDTTKFT